MSGFRAGQRSTIPHLSRVVRPLAALLVLVGPLLAQAPGGLTPRPVHDASSWAAVQGPLRPLWDAWKSAEAAKGVIWDDEGHILSVQGARVISSQRADSVPAAAVTWMVQNAGQAGLLVGGSPGAVGSLLGAEMQRVGAANDAAREAEQARAREAAEAAEGTGDGTLGQGSSGDPGGTGGSGEPGSEGSAPGSTDGEGGTTGGEGTGEFPVDGSEGGNGTGPNEIPEGGDPGTGPSDTNEEVPDLTGGNPDPTAGTVSHKDLVYGTQHPRQVLDLYLPADAPAGGKLPLVVFFHGGAFVKGDKKDVGAFLPIVDAGYALASCNYLLLNKSSPDQVNFLDDAADVAKTAYDARRAVRWLKDNADTYGLDPGRVAAVGASAGGYIAATVGSASDVGKLKDETGGSSTSAAVQGVIDWSGPTNFATFFEHKNGSSPFPTSAATAVLDSKGAVSPYDYVSGGDPPTLIRHGELDQVVPVQQSTTYASALRKAGVQVDIKTYPNLGHEADKAFLDDEVGAIIDFLDQVLR